MRRVLVWQRGYLVVALVAVLSAIATVTPTPVQANEARAADPDDRPMAVLARELESRLRADLAPTFAGVVLASDGVLEVLTVGHDPRAADIASQVRKEISGADVRVLGGRQHSLSALEALQEVVTDRAPVLVSQGIDLTGWGVDLRTNTIRITVRERSQEVVRRLGIEFGDHMISVYAEEPASTVAKTYDAPPWGGAIQLNRSGGTCTSGYNIVMGGVGKVITAGHCGWSTWNNGGYTVGSTTHQIWCAWCNGDAQVIHPSGGTRGVIWIDNNNARGVSHYGTADLVGESVCSNGITSGERCGSLVEATNVCRYMQNHGIYVCGLTEAFNSYQYLSNGDSGGAVYQHRGDGYLTAKGIIAARHESNTRWWYTPSGRIAALWGPAQRY